MIFETKKINHETLSEYLMGIRKQVGLSLEDVSAKTGIKLGFLKNLENGNFQALPADVYVLGFVRQLAQMYAIDSEELIKQFKKERGIEQQLVKHGTFNPSKMANYLGRLVITPKYLSLVVGFLFVIVTVGYIVWQVLSINKAPNLEISQPQDRQIIKQSSVTVAGKTDPGMSVSINNQDVFVDNTGAFTIQLGIGSGPKTLTFIAKNKFDKSVSKSISIIGEVTSEQVLGVDAQANVVLKLQFTKPVSIDYWVDDGAKQHEDVASGTTKSLVAKSNVRLSTSDAGATIATLNNKSLGALGRANEVLTNIPFSAESATIKPDDSGNPAP